MEMSPQCNVLDLSSDQFYSFMAPFVHVSDIVLFNAKYIGHVCSSTRIISDRSFKNSILTDIIDWKLINGLLFSFL